MLSIDLSKYRELTTAAAKAALPAGFLAGAGAAAALRLWPGTVGRGAACGLAAAWVLASLGAVVLLAARAVSVHAFWTAFWSGVGSRVAVLIGLMLYCVHSPASAAPSLLAGYGLGVAFLLPLELRQVPLR